MYLKSLSIISDNKVIREINFHNGLNLIVDETEPSKGKETGNNVGKTTVLMLIDYCLGGDGKDIYTDPENKRGEYKLVKDFLIDKKVLIRLVLKENLSIQDSIEHCIEKNFLGRNKKIQRINGISRNDSEFDEALTNILVPNHYNKKPTFRQIISHNIRYKDQNINNTLKTLSPFTRDEEYETLYLFLLGCDYDKGEKRQELLAKIRMEEKFKKRLENEQTKSAYMTALSILDNEINELDRKKCNLNLNERLEIDIDDLNKIRFEINIIVSAIGKLNIRRNLIIEAKQDLNLHRSNIDLQQLKIIYEQATSQVKEIQKTFEELFIFHNQMISEKVKFIVKDLPELDKEIKSKSEQLKRLSQKEKKLASVISHSDSFYELEDLITEINEKFRMKGEFENIIQQIEKVEKNLTAYYLELKQIDDLLFSADYKQTIQIQVDIFNKYFTEVSQELYGEKFALKVDKVIKKGKYIYKFDSFNTNFSSGKKQGEISCFDIAYTLFADEENIPCFHFLLNDKKELMHDNQLIAIAKLVEKENIQFVASILKDKLPEELNQERYFIIRLSQSDKLFRIENP